jgi:hypothetical protein
VGIVEEARLAEWARQTEIGAGKGAARRGGKWKVELLSADKQNAALDVYEQVRAAGYAAEIFPTLKGGKRLYVVVIGQPALEARSPGARRPTARRARRRRSQGRFLRFLPSWKEKSF